MTNSGIATAGIALLILLPVLRILVMLTVFARARPPFGLIAMLVLAMRLKGALLGMHAIGSMPG